MQELQIHKGSKRPRLRDDRRLLNLAYLTEKAIDSALSLRFLGFRLYLRVLRFRLHVLRLDFRVFRSR